MKKRWKETQTLHAGCSKVEPKIFTPPQTPFPGARDGQNLISWRWSLPLPTNPVWWGSMHAISSYRSNRPTNKHKHSLKPTNRQDRLRYTARQLARSVINNPDIFRTALSVVGCIIHCIHPSVLSLSTTKGSKSWKSTMRCPIASERNAIRSSNLHVWYGMVWYGILEFNFPLDKVHFGVWCATGNEHLYGIRSQVKVTIPYNSVR